MDAREPTMPASNQSAKNTRLALILASVAIAFFVGFIVKATFFGV